MRLEMIYRALLVAFALICAFPAGGKIYRWVDEKGTKHFTDQYYSVPEQYRPQLETGAEIESGPLIQIERAQSGRNGPDPGKDSTTVGAPVEPGVTVPSPPSSRPASTPNIQPSRSFAGWFWLLGLVLLAPVLWIALSGRSETAGAVGVDDWRDLLPPPTV